MGEKTLLERLSKRETAFGKDAFKKGLYWKLKQDVISQIAFRKINEKNIIKETKKIVNTNSSNFIKKFKSLKNSEQLKLGQYFFKIGKNLNKNIEMFTRRDNDGITRDYYGFPIEMDIDERRKNLMGSTRNDCFARYFLGFRETVDRSKFQELMAARNEYIIRRSRELRRKKRKNNLKPEAIILQELKAICVSKVIPSLNTIRQIIYRRKRYVK